MFGYLLILVTLGLMWLLLIRPQQRRMRQHEALVRSLEVGDDIVTTSGIYGTITALDDDRAEVEVAPGVRIHMARAAVGARTDGAAETATGTAVDTATGTAVETADAARVPPEPGELSRPATPGEAGP